MQARYFLMRDMHDEKRGGAPRMGRWSAPHDKRTRPHPASLRRMPGPTGRAPVAPATMRPVIALRRCLKHGAPPAARTT